MDATMAKTADAQPSGKYVETAVDVAKGAADIRVIAIDGTATVISRVLLSGRGVTARSNPGTYEVTKSALARLEKTHTVACDF